MTAPDSETLAKLLDDHFQHLADGRSGLTEMQMRADHLAADLIATRAEVLALRKRVEAAESAHGALWRALAEMIEVPGYNPNATVRRMAARAERALIEDTASDVKPEPRFYQAPKQEQTT